MRARCRRTMVRRVRWLVPDPGPAVGFGHRWARGTANRWVGTRFVALFAGAHAPNDSVEADRTRGHNSPPPPTGRLQVRTTMSSPFRGRWPEGPEGAHQRALHRQGLPLQGAPTHTSGHSVPPTGRLQVRTTMSSPFRGRWPEGPEGALSNCRGENSDKPTGPTSSVRLDRVVRSMSVSEQSDESGTHPSIRHPPSPSTPKPDSPCHALFVATGPAQGGQGDVFCRWSAQLVRVQGP